MKITKAQLKQIIKEELDRVLEDKFQSMGDWPSGGVDVAAGLGPKTSRLVGGDPGEYTEEEEEDSWLTWSKDEVYDMLRSKGLNPDRTSPPWWEALSTNDPTRVKFREWWNCKYKGRCPDLSGIPPRGKDPAEPPITSAELGLSGPEAVPIPGAGYKKHKTYRRVQDQPEWPLRKK